LTSPDGAGRIDLQPVSAISDEATIRVRPWPWVAVRQKFSASGLRIPAQQYATDSELHTAIAQSKSVWLKWTLEAW
jgi:hypothetical protein